MFCNLPVIVDSMVITSIIRKMRLLQYRLGLATCCVRGTINQIMSVAKEVIMSRDQSANLLLLIFIYYHIAMKSFLEYFTLNIIYFILRLKLKF